MTRLTPTRTRPDIVAETFTFAVQETANKIMSPQRTFTQGAEVGRILEWLQLRGPPPISANESRQGGTLSILIGQNALEAIVKLNIKKDVVVFVS